MTISKIYNYFNRKVLLKRLLWTIFIVVLFKLGSFVPLPAIHYASYDAIKATSAFKLADMSSGGQLSTMSMFILGTTPFITASLVTQLLSQHLSKKYTRWSQQGSAGQQKIAQKTKLYTLLFAFLESIAIITLMIQLKIMKVEIDTSPLMIIESIILMMTGAMIVTQLGESINRHGLGSGISVLIAAGIAMKLPETTKIFISEAHHSWNRPYPYIILSIVILIVVLTIIANNIKMIVPLQSTQNTEKIKAHYLPIKALAGSMVPVIFASSLMSMISLAVKAFNPKVSFNYLSNIKLMCVYAGVIIVFTFFYNLSQLDPQKMSKNFIKSQVYALDHDTYSIESYLTKSILKMSISGSILLAFLALSTSIALIFMQSQALSMMSGTSILILVSVIQEMINQSIGLYQRDKYLKTDSKIHSNSQDTITLREVRS